MFMNPTLTSPFAAPVRPIQIVVAPDPGDGEKLTRC